MALPPSRRSAKAVPVRPVTSAWRSPAPARPAAEPPPVPEPPPAPRPAAVDRRALARSSTAPGLPKMSAPFVSVEEKEHKSRRSKRAQRRRRRWRMAAGVVAAIFLTASAAAGFWWQKNKIEQAGEVAAPVSAVTPEQKAEALRLIDEAVAAKHEGRVQSAINAAQRARSVDPEVHGVDILLGEMAFEAQEPQSVERAAREALRRNDNIADAKLLLALATWMQREGMGKNATTAAQSALQYLDEATADEASNAPVFFFRGELARMTGGNSERAQRALLGAVHRMQPWFSTAYLSAQRYAAAVARGGAVELATEPVGQALVDLDSSTNPAGDRSQVIGSLARSMTITQVKQLSQDYGMSPEYLQVAGDESVEIVPYGAIQAPDPGEIEDAYAR